MNMKQRLGIILLSTLILTLVYIIYNSADILIPGSVISDGNAVIRTIYFDGDGYILSRTLLILYTLHVISKFAFYLLDKKD